MPDFGFKAKLNEAVKLFNRDDSMPDFGFKAKLILGGRRSEKNDSMPDFGFKAKLDAVFRDGVPMIACLILDSRQN